MSTSRADSNTPPRLPPRRGALLHGMTLLALFGAALVANLRAAGTSPTVWLDTYRDQIEVQRCVVDDSCTLTGMSTSIPGQSHAVAWLQMRSLLAWLGADLEQAHIVVQVAQALAIVVIFHLASQLGGGLAGVFALLILVVAFPPMAQATALHNSNALPILGAVFVLACTAAILRPGWRAVALAALVAAVMANVHMACVVAGVSVVWVALAAPGHRLTLAAFAAVLFATATFAIAPPGWLHNLNHLLDPEKPFGHAAGLITTHGDSVVRWAFFAFVAWLVSFVSRSRRWVEYRSHAHGAIAVTMPMLATYLAAPFFGVQAEAKYLMYVTPACAMAAALPLAGLAEVAFASLPVEGLRRGLDRGLPIVLAVALAAGLGGHSADEGRFPTVGDLDAVARILRVEHGWEPPLMLQRLRTPYGVAALIGLQHTEEPTAVPPSAPTSDANAAILLVIPASHLPRALPPNWRVLRRSADSVSLLVTVRSLIDWSSFEVCVHAQGEAQMQCRTSSLRLDEEGGVFVPSLPPTGGGWRGSFELRLHLRAAPEAFVDEIFMPRMPSICGGRIVSESDGIVEVDSSGRRAILSAAKPAGGSLLRLQWEVGSPECDVTTHGPVPPFFLEGEADSVRLLGMILRKGEI